MVNTRQWVHFPIYAEGVDKALDKYNCFVIKKDPCYLELRKSKGSGIIIFKRGDDHDIKFCISRCRRPREKLRYPMSIKVSSWIKLVVWKNSSITERDVLLKEIDLWPTVVLPGEVKVAQGIEKRYRESFSPHKEDHGKIGPF